MNDFFDRPRRPQDAPVAAADAPPLDAAARLSAIDWAEVGTELDEQGAALLPGLLDPAACRALEALYDAPDEAAPPLFRSRVVMERHGYGRGEYRYFA
jgi:hypothetical protein